MKEVYRLGSLLKLNQRGKQPIYREEGLPVINSKHVRIGMVITDNNRNGERELNSIIIEKNDVLINGTGVGTIGRSAPFLEEIKALPDNHVTVLRTEAVDSVYLSIFLNSIAGQLQFEKYFSGSSGQIELYPSDIAQVFVWKAPTELQKEIRLKVEESHRSREQSKTLLQVAKQAVETAIEQGEAAAETLLEAHLRKEKTV